MILICIVVLCFLLLLVAWMAVSPIVSARVCVGKLLGGRMVSHRRDRDMHTIKIEILVLIVVIDLRPALFWTLEGQGVTLCLVTPTSALCSGNSTEHLSQPTSQRT